MQAKCSRHFYRPDGIRATSYRNTNEFTEGPKCVRCGHMPHTKYERVILRTPKRPYT